MPWAYQSPIDEIAAWSRAKPNAYSVSVRLQRDELG